MAEMLTSPILVKKQSSKSPDRQTGIPKKCLENCCEFSNCIKKWDELVKDGLRLIIEIGEEVLKNKNDDETLNERAWSNSIQINCDKLTIVHEQMVFQKNQMRDLVSRMEALAELQKLSEPSSSFVTKCWEHASYVFSCYEAECLQKKLLVENVAHISDSDQLIILRSVWRLQPKIKRDVEHRVLAILEESGAF